MQEFMPLL